MFEVVDLVIFVIVGLIGLWLFRKSKNWKWIDRLVTGIVEPDIVEEYDRTIELAEQQVVDTEKEEEKLKAKKDKIKARVKKV